MNRERGRPRARRGGRTARRGLSARVAALVSGALLALLLCAGEAAAQATCEGPTSGIPSRGYQCEVAAAGTGDITMSYEDLSHTTTLDSDHVIDAAYLGATGKIDIDARGGSLATTGETARGISAVHQGAGTGTPAVAIDIDLSNADVRATGEGLYVSLAPAPSPPTGRESVSGEVRVRVTGGSITSAGVALSVASRAREKIDVDLSGVEIETTGRIQHGVYAYQNGGGDIEIDVEGGSIETAETSAYGVFANVQGVAQGDDYASGDVRLTLRETEIETAGSTAHGVHVRQQGTGRGDIRVDARGGAVKTAGNSASGLYLQHDGATGDAVVRLEDVEISTGRVVDAETTTGRSARGVHVFKTGSTDAGDIDIQLTGGSISTLGSSAYGVHAEHAGKPSGGESADIAVRLRGTDLRTESHGVYAYHRGRQLHQADDPDANEEATDVLVSVRGGSIESGYNGVFAFLSSDLGDVVVEVRDASVKTTGNRSYGVYGYRTGSARNVSGGSLLMTLEDASVETDGNSAFGVYARHAASPQNTSLDSLSRVDLSRVSVTTTGDYAHGLMATESGSGDVLVNFARGRIRTEGVNAIGLNAEQGLGTTGYLTSTGAITPFGVENGLGSIDFRVGAEARVEAPFFIGMRGLMRNNGSADGRLLINHAGAIEARDAGVFAWAPRMSGHTFGEGAQTADDAARTAPLVHVVSSGDITVGASVMDDFIRERIAGADGALSDPERTVLDAISANDSDALEAALDALSDSYDEDWKAEARNLLRKRGWTPNSAVREAHAAADEVLGLVPTGIRVLVLDHRAYAEYVRYGDFDRALNRWWPPLTDEEQALYDEQQKLSEDERAVLEALLLGGDLEAALARLTPLYTDYKDVVRSLARRYNAGDVRVDVTGGTIAAEGDGIYARYAIPHERNGAIAVNVGQGAVVSGGRNGLWVGGAGAGEGNFLAQSVTVDGTVAGGTGAGVYMKGGGRLAVGETGRISASSGSAILADGPGDFNAAIAGRVEGDVRSMGAGAFTATISGMVEGDVTSMGDLTAVISGMVTGDVEGLGAGDHTVTVSPGGEVAGVIHLAASSVVVDGRVCAVILDAGGVVTVGASGVVKELEGVSIRAGGGTLRVEVSLGDRPLSEVVGGAIVLAGGEPDIFVNGVRLSGAAEGGTGAEVPNGARDVRLVAGASGVSLIDDHAPRAGVYESLPGLLLRMESGRARGERTTAPGLPVWVRLSAEEGSRGASRSTSSAKYDFDSRGLEAGLAFSFPWREGLAGSLSVRHQRGSAKTSLPDGGGKIDLAGVGLGAGLSWERGDGWRLRGEFSVMDYDADLTSGKWGKLRSGVDASVRALDLEASRRFAPGERLALSPRVWLTRSAVSMDGFTDSVGARVRLVKGSRFTGGIGAVAETARPVQVGGGTLALRGSLDLSEILSGSKTSVQVTGERLHAEAEKTRLLLGIGARWRRGRFSLDAALSAAGQGAGDETFAARLGVGMRF